MGRERFERCSAALRDRAAFELRRIWRMASRLRWLQNILDAIGIKTAVTKSAYAEFIENQTCWAGLPPGYG